MSGRRRDAVRRTASSSGGILTATLVLIAVVALMAAVDVIVLHNSGSSQGYVRLMGIAFVLDILGSVLMPILRKVEQTERKPPA